MSALWRARIGSFLAGAGITAIAAFTVLREDLATSFKDLGDKVQLTDTSDLEQRVRRLEDLNKNRLSDDRQSQ